jgi:protein-L-isoaspartate(D-aspartate) O-methyltransferase
MVDQHHPRASSGNSFLPKGLDRRAIRDREVVGAISRVPRHLFVPEGVEHLAYDDRALGIGSNQTISQPFIVALMTQEAKVRPGSRVLEIGTGSGYQAAVLAELGAEVFTIEILPELSYEAEARLDELGIEGVRFRIGDGALGWEEEAPFDAILVTAACPAVPDALLAQLADPGRLILPLEKKEPHTESLVAIEKAEGKLSRRSLGTVRFVPLTGCIRGEDTAE